MSCTFTIFSECLTRSPAPRGHFDQGPDLNSSLALSSIALQDTLASGSAFEILQVQIQVNYALLTYVVVCLRPCRVCRRHRVCYHMICNIVYVCHRRLFPQDVRGWRIAANLFEALLMTHNRRGPDAYLHDTSKGRIFVSKQRNPSITVQTITSYCKTPAFCLPVREHCNDFIFPIFTLDFSQALKLPPPPNFNTFRLCRID